MLSSFGGMNGCFIFRLQLCSPPVSCGISLLFNQLGESGCLEVGFCMRAEKREKKRGRGVMGARGL
jgi:hypothetical protein